MLIRWVKGALARLRADEGGAALVLTLILLGLGGLVLVPTLALTETGLSSVRMYQDKTKEYYTADAGVLHGVWKLGNASLTFPHSYQQTNLNDRTADITITDQGNDQYKIISVSGDTTITAYVELRFSIIEQGDFEVSSDLVDPDGIYAGGDIFLINGAEIEGNVGRVYAEGDIVLTSGAEIEEEVGDLCVYAGGDITLLTAGGMKSEIESKVGDVCVCAGGDITLGDTARIKATVGDVNVYVPGDLILGDGAWITGDVYVGGAVTLGSGAYITGSIYPYQECPSCSSGAARDVLSWDIN